MSTHTSASILGKEGVITHIKVHIELILDVCRRHRPVQHRHKLGIIQHLNLLNHDLASRGIGSVVNDLHSIVKDKGVWDRVVPAKRQLNNHEQTRADMSGDCMTLMA
jgi:hypothetical protein